MTPEVVLPQVRNSASSLCESSVCGSWLQNVSTSRDDSQRRQAWTLASRHGGVPSPMFLSVASKMIVPCVRQGFVCPSFLKIKVVRFVYIFMRALALCAEAAFSLSMRR